MVFDCCGPRGWQDQARCAAQRLPRSQGSSVHVAILEKKVHVALPQVVNLNMVRGGWKGGSLCGFQPDWMITYPNIGVAASIPAKSQENQKDPPPNKVGPMFLSSDIQNKNVATTIWTCPCSSRFFGATSKLLAL